jgi:pantoate ligase/cytidylate kinase
VGGFFVVWEHQWMQLITTARELGHWRRHCRAPVHFVPTMGALHHGHRHLIERALQPAGGSSPQVVVSVFVNPLQFGPGEDFQRYPRDLQADAALAEAAGAAVLFAPGVEEIYPGGEAEAFGLRVPAGLQAVLCGRSRPGHFDGVATVVSRLLALVQPDRLLLGEKDWQQLVILRRMVAALNLPLVVEGCATVRDPDGLAASSRNRYLTPAERHQALALPQALAAARLGHASPVSSADPVAAARRALEVAGLTVDYVELVEASTLCPHPAPQALAVLAAAVHCGSARLIDHTFLMSRSPIVAIDGPAGAGKSTVTRAFAARLGLIYLDTGAMYRAVTWWVQRQGGDPADAAVVAPLLEGLDLQLSAGAGGEQQVSVNGHDVTSAIRSPDVTAQVSVVAAHGCVREALTRQQQAMGERGGLVAEGRDIGTAVFPDAELKVFLTATVSERARRRALDLDQRGFEVPPLEDLEAQIAERDHLDSTREVAPLQMAADAVELITDGMTIDAVIQALVDLFRSRVPEEAWPRPVAS